MKLNITSPSAKRVRYKVYDLNGKRRKLLSKGKFLHNIETDIKTAGNQLIVRIQRYNIFIALLKAIYVVIVNLSLMPGRDGFFESMPQYLTLYPFEEIHIADIGFSEQIKIQYNPAPLTRMVYRSDRPEKNLIVDYLICSTHKFTYEWSGRKNVNKIIYTFAITFWIALITAICLIIRFFVLHR